MPQTYSDKLYGLDITHYDCTQSSLWFQYRLLTMTTSFEIVVLHNKHHLKDALKELAIGKILIVIHDNILFLFSP